jgi:type I restriction enzyme R subunit
VIRPSATAQNYIDLSNIDFEALKEKFEKGRKPIEIQKLRGQVAQKLVQMVKLNRTRMNFLEEFQKMIEEYNSGASNLETLFDRLMAFTKRFTNKNASRSTSMFSIHTPDSPAVSTSTDEAGAN